MILLGVMQTSVWYLVPVFFGILGGVIAWAVNNDRNPEKALKFLVFGIISTVFFIIVGWMFWAVILTVFFRGLHY